MGCRQVRLSLGRRSPPGAPLKSRADVRRRSAAAAASGGRPRWFAARLGRLIARSSGARRSSPLGLALGACILLAVLSAVVLPTVPSYDPFSWVVWGREVSDPHLSFRLSGGPSWKPLPFLFTTVWGLFGGAAPTLWVITARVGGLLGLYFAWRLARRLTAPGVLRHVAGGLAVIGIVLTLDWPYYFLRGTSEVVLIGPTLGGSSGSHPAAAGRPTGWRSARG